MLKTRLNLKTKCTCNSIMASNFILKQLSLCCCPILL